MKINTNIKQSVYKKVKRKLKVDTEKKHPVNRLLASLPHKAERSASQFRGEVRSVPESQTPLEGSQCMSWNNCPLDENVMAGPGIEPGSS